MKLKEFTESVATLLGNGVYYYEETRFETPLKIKQISEQAMENLTETIMVEFFDPEDTFILTVGRKNNEDKANADTDEI